MVKADTRAYAPDAPVPPSMVIEDYLDALKLTQVDLAQRTGLTKEIISDLMGSRAPISPEIALKFQRALGRPAHFWSDLERQYQQDLQRQHSSPTG